MAIDHAPNGSQVTDAPQDAVTIQIGGKERHFLLDFNAIRRLDKITGGNFLQETNLWLSQTGVSAERMTLLFWACLLHEEPDLDVDTVGGWLTIPRLRDINAALAATVQNAMPELDPATAEPDAEAEADPNEGQRPPPRRRR